MRKIKFRGKRKDNGMWIVGSLIPNGEKKAYIAPLKELFHLEEVCVETVGQFTGLHDRYGNDIYEGDVIHFAKYGNEYTAAVKWNIEIGAWCLKLNYEPRLGCKPLGDWLLYDSLEIIGNIHDNPEMIR